MNEDLFPTEHEDFFDVMLGFQGCRLVKVSGIEEVPTSREWGKEIDAQYDDWSSTPWKINGWNSNMDVWKVSFLFNWQIF